jgi:acetyl-CoA synthetase
VIAPEKLCSTREFRRVRDALIRMSSNVAIAAADFRLPVIEHFNWALDWFDKISTPDNVALCICGHTEDTSITFQSLSRRSNQVANWLESRGVCRGDRVFLLLGNSIPLYEIILACIKIGAVVIPGFLSLSKNELRRRIQLGNIKFLLHSNSEIVASAELPITIDSYNINPTQNCFSFAQQTSTFPDIYVPMQSTISTEPMFGYYTSGTTSDPKLVIHSHSSYPIGHLSSMYWNGVRPGDVHFNVSAPGWAKHTWSSFFVPWNAEATAVILEQATPSSDMLLDIVRRKKWSGKFEQGDKWKDLLI